MSAWDMTLEPTLFTFYFLLLINFVARCVTSLPSGRGRGVNCSRDGEERGQGLSNAGLRTAT